MLKSAYPFEEFGEGGGGRGEGGGEDQSNASAFANAVMARRNDRRLFSGCHNQVSFHTHQ